jgi:hypothetical protein
LPTKLKKKFDVILARERQMAKAIAFQAIKPKPFSVWEVLIPVVFILSFMRSKEQRELFAQNLMFTKKMALEAAFEMLHKKRSKAAVLSRIASETQDLLASVADGVYSEEIRLKQMQEIDLLIDHYGKLMGGEGRDYATLVANAYRTRKDYQVFQDKLTSAERRVTQAARETLGNQTDDQMVARIDTASDRFRRQEVETIYSHH